MAWAGFWATTAVMAIPGLILLVWLMRLYPDDGKPQPEKATAESPS